MQLFLTSLLIFGGMLRQKLYYCSSFRTLFSTLEYKKKPTQDPEIWTKSRTVLHKIQKTWERVLLKNINAYIFNISH